MEPQDPIQALLKEITERYPENLPDDDATVMVIRANGRKPRPAGLLSNCHLSWRLNLYSSA